MREYSGVFSQSGVSSYFSSSLAPYDLLASDTLTWVSDREMDLQASWWTTDNIGTNFLQGDAGNGSLYSGMYPFKNDTPLTSPDTTSLLMPSSPPTTTTTAPSIVPKTVYPAIPAYCSVSPPIPWGTAGTKKVKPHPFVEKSLHGRGDAPAHGGGADLSSLLQTSINNRSHFPLLQAMPPPQPLLVCGMPPTTPHRKFPHDRYNYELSHTRSLRPTQWRYATLLTKKVMEEEKKTLKTPKTSPTTIYWPMMDVVLTSPTVSPPTTTGVTAPSAAAADIAGADVRVSPEGVRLQSPLHPISFENFSNGADGMPLSMVLPNTRSTITAALLGQKTSLLNPPKQQHEPHQLDLLSGPTIPLTLSPDSFIADEEGNILLLPHVSDFYRESLTSSPSCRSSNASLSPPSLSLQIASAVGAAAVTAPREIPASSLLGSSDSSSDDSQNEDDADEEEDEDEENEAPVESSAFTMPTGLGTTTTISSVDGIHNGVNIGAVEESLMGNASVLQRWTAGNRRRSDLRQRLLRNQRRRLLRHDNLAPLTPVPNGGAAADQTRITPQLPQHRYPHAAQWFRENGESVCDMAMVEMPSVFIKRSLEFFPYPPNSVSAASPSVEPHSQRFLPHNGTTKRPYPQPDIYSTIPVTPKAPAVRFEDFLEFRLCHVPKVVSPSWEAVEQRFPSETSEQSNQETW